MNSNKALLLLALLLITTVGCGGSNKNSKGSGGGPNSGTSSGKAITKSYFPTTSTQDRQYIERRFQPVKYDGKPKPDLNQLPDKTYSGRWTEPTQAENNKYGSDVLIWSSNDFFKRRAYRVSNVGVELEDSVGGTMVGRANRDDYFYFWKPLVKWGSMPGEVWDTKIKEKSADQTYALNRTYSALYESTVENDGKTCVVIAFTEHNIPQEQFELRKYWLMDGVGIVRLELYSSAVYAPGHPKEEDGKWWRPVQQLIFQEWKGEVAPLDYLPRGKNGEAISGNDAAVVSSGKITQPTATTRKERPALEQKAIDEIRKLNGKIQYADSSPAAPVVKVSFGGVRGSDLGMLKDLPDIKELDLGGGESTVVDITFIAPLTKLTVLDLPCVVPDQFAILADLPSLETLTVGIAKPSLSSAGIDNPYKNRDATKEFNSQDFLKQAIDRLSKSRSLKNLRLRAQTSPLGRAQATTCSSIDRLPRLTFLDLSHLTLGDDNFAALGRCVNLNTLVLTNWNGKAFSEKGIQQLSGCKNLKRLSIKGASDSIVGVSASLPSLAHLDCPVSRLSDAQLVSVRQSNTQLTLTERPPHPKWWGSWLADNLKALDPMPAVVTPSGSDSTPTPSVSSAPSRPNETKPPITSQPIIGRWNNVTTNGWAMEFLATGEAINIDPKGVVDTRGTWKDEGKGKFSARLGENNEWEWRATVQENTLVVEALLNGKPHSKSTFSRHLTIPPPISSKPQVKDDLSVVTKVDAAAAEKSKDEVALFNGNDLDGWKFVVAPAFKQELNLHDCWGVDAERGVLLAKGNGPTWLASEQTYDNFSLRLEWRFLPNAPQTPNGSGVVVRASGIHSRNLDPRGIEADISEKTTGWFICYGTPLLNKKAKALGEETQALERLADPDLKNIGEWNTTEIHCDGDRITVTVNGKKINEATGARIKKGEICLRSQNSAIEFRKVRLAPKTAPRDGRYAIRYDNGFSQTVNIKGNLCTVESAGNNGNESALSFDLKGVFTRRDDNSYAIEIGDTFEIWHTTPSGMEVHHWQKGADRNKPRTQVGAVQELSK